MLNPNQAAMSQGHMIPLLLLALGPAPEELSLLGEVPALCADAAMTQCWTPTKPDGFQGNRLFVTEIGEKSSALSVQVSGVRLHPWVPAQSLELVVDEVSTFPFSEQASLTLLPGLAIPPGQVLDLEFMELPLPWTDANPPSMGRSYVEMEPPSHTQSQAVLAEMKQSSGPWVQMIPKGQTLHAEPKGPVIATMGPGSDAKILDRQGPWTLVLIERPYFQLRAWAHDLPAPEPPPAIGFCGGGHGYGPGTPPRTIVLEADTPLYLAQGDAPIAHTLDTASFVVQVDEDERIGIQLSTAWGMLMVYPEAKQIQSADLEAFRGWLAEGPLYAKAKDGSCTEASLVLPEGPFPAAELKVMDTSEIPGGACEHSVSLAWKGNNTLSSGGPGGFCEFPDGTGSGWMNSGHWTQTFTVQEQGWVKLAGEWLNHDLAVCESSEPQTPPIEGSPASDEASQD
jgi:hypothetical protein